MFLALDQKRTIGGVENRNTKVDETEYMSVSENSGFSPQIIQFNRGFPLFSPSILGYKVPIFGNTYIKLEG